MLEDIDWTLFVHMDVDTCWDLLYQNMTNILGKLCPEKRFKFAKNRPTWITNDLINLMKERDSWLQLFLKSRLEIDKKKMRRVRNLVNVSVKNARADVVKDQLETHKNDPKKFWKELNNLIPKNNSGNAQNFNNIKDIHSQIIAHEVLPNSVKNCFADIGIELDKKNSPTNTNRI